MKNNYNEKYIVIFLALFFLMNSMSFFGIHAEETFLPKEYGDVNSDDDLVGYWTFDEGVGKISEDQSDYNNHGEIYGASWTTGYLGDALEFDGEWDYVFIQDHESINFYDTNELTIDLWFKWDGTEYEDRGQNLLNKHTKKGGGYTLIICNNNNSLRFRINEGGDNNFCDLYWDELDTQWHRVTAVWDGYTQILYIDGKIVNSAVRSNFRIGNADKPLEIGNNWGYADNLNTFNGIIDEVRIYEKAKTYVEIEGILKIDVPKDNNEDRLKNEGLFNIGGSCSLTWPDVSDIQVKLEGQNGVSTPWVNATGWDHWSYEANISSFPTGKVTIKARCLDFFGNPIDNIGVVERIIYFDPECILPEVILKNPLGNNLLSGVIDIEGEIKDNDNKISCVQILIEKYMDDWQNVYVIHHEDKNDEWLYKFDTLKGNDSSYIFYLRVKDDECNKYNKTYWSPIFRYDCRVDNYFPESTIRIPHDNYIHLFYDRTRRKIFNPLSEGTIILGHLTCKIQVLQNHEYVEGVNIFVNDDVRPYRVQKSSDPTLWTCDAWNHFGGFGLVNKEVNLHIRVFKESGHVCELETTFMKIF